MINYLVSVNIIWKSVNNVQAIIGIETSKASPFGVISQKGGIVMHWRAKLSLGPTLGGPSQKLDQCIGISAYLRSRHWIGSL